MAQKKEIPKHPGAFKSCLIPFAEQILNWWYDDLLTSAEIQRRLAAQGVEVDRTTVMRFVKVRERRALERQRPAALQKSVPSTNTPKEPASTSRKVSIPNSFPRPSPTIDPEHATGEELLNYLERSTPQELGRAAKEAAMKKL